MAKETKIKALHYRRANFVQGDSNLQLLLRAALAKLRTVDTRLEQLGSSESDQRCINNHPAQFGMQFGNMLSFERGANRLLLSTNTKVATLDVAQIAPIPIKGVPSEFLDGILFFGVQGNHVILLQSSALTSRHFEVHLNWLLSAAGVMGTDDRLELVDTPKPNIRRAIEDAPIKRVKFGAPFLDLASSVEGETLAQRRQSLRLIPEGVGVSILKAVLGERAFSKLHLDKAVEGNLKVALEVTYDRTTNEGGQKVLHAIARELRHVDDEDVSVSIPGIGSVKGRDLKLSDTRSIQSYDGLLDQNEVFQAMHEWLRSLLESGLVVADNGAGDN